MPNMFTSYEASARSFPCPPAPATKGQKDIKILTNIKGEVLGVQIDYNSPLQLYFHLENVWEVDFKEISRGVAVFEILTTTHKVLISHEYPIADILDQYTNDLYISLNLDEMKPLKKETYNMRVTLKTTEMEYVVFAEKDGYLVIR
jgi:hypothetical protein